MGKIVWMNEHFRAVLTAEGQVSLEKKEADKDALGNDRWTPQPWSIDLFQTILISLVNRLGI